MVQCIGEKYQLVQKNTMSTHSWRAKLPFGLPWQLPNAQAALSSASVQLPMCDGELWVHAPSANKTRLVAMMVLSSLMAWYLVTTCHLLVCQSHGQWWHHIQTATTGVRADTQGNMGFSLLTKDTSTHSPAWNYRSYDEVGERWLDSSRTVSYITR